MTSAPAPGAGRIEIEFSDGYLVRIDNQVKAHPVSVLFPITGNKPVAKVAVECPGLTMMAKAWNVVLTGAFVRVFD
ncbi:hypothetical protein EOA85_32055 [Mesorhizobium sp. M5C.F.Ca.IN.020.29.1.1]|nr:hypothetical protein EOA85_32055 [Mesorhizobium sp. M5C.F.Ca.IN.020.29.1.1]